ncbi:hypothetical protein CGRA01v4_02455 [Colletotrichum graminicola]|nr:hypothetical protein CGRA01v4_02455 [Colletotrichum graminicola]
MSRSLGHLPCSAPDVCPTLPRRTLQPRPFLVKHQPRDLSCFVLDWRPRPPIRNVPSSSSHSMPRPTPWPAHRHSGGIVCSLASFPAFPCPRAHLTSHRCRFGSQHQDVPHGS